MSDTIGFIGLGIMGYPMAKNLLEKGVDLLVYDVRDEPVKRLAAGAGTAAATTEPAGISYIAERCDIIFTMLPDDNICEQVIIGENGLVRRVRAGTLVADMSSVTPACANKCSAGLAARGAAHLDAPVSGGEPKAIDGSLAIMVGGEQADFERALPYLEKMGGSVKLVGKSGAGALCKLTNQVIVNLNIAAMSEAFVLLCKAGGDPRAVYEAIRYGSAGSEILDTKLMKILNRDFAPGGKMSINYKDIGNVMATAKAFDVPMPLTAQLYEIMRSMKALGGPDEDHASIVRHFERLSGIEVK